ncbi:MAG TPA: BBP7 family outer membrane beta-barrel protein [Gemmataceae bacterium]|nr:BBP7 family outer membrane beta-barrel protein [Gemmataceae bacterium]
MRMTWWLAWLALLGAARACPGQDSILSPGVPPPEGCASPTENNPNPFPGLSAPEGCAPAIGDNLAPWTAPAGSPGRFWAEADYVIYWLKPVCFTVPGLSVGNLSDPQPGVLGQPGSQLVQGDSKFQLKGANGIRPRIGVWLTDDQFLGLEAEGFVLEQVASGGTVASNSNGGPPLFLVFQEPNNANAALPFSVPGVVAASSSAVGESRLWGAETNTLFHISTQRGACTLHATALVGCRYLNLDDRVIVSNRQSLVSDPSVTASGQANFATQNQFVGGQVGSRFGCAYGRVRLDLTTKLAFGETYLVSEVAGSPLLSGSSVQPGLVPGPLLALPSNVGRLASERITVVPEFNLRLRWQVCNRFYLTLGYNLLYWNKILCPGDQMDALVNTTQLPSRGPVVGPADPAPKFVFTDAFAQGLEAGFGFTF